VPTPVAVHDDDPAYYDRLAREQQQEQEQHNNSDAERSIFWDIATLSPLGAVAATGVDVAKMAYHGLTGDNRAAARDAVDAAGDALGAVPGLGTFLSVDNLVQDVGALDKRGKGASADSAPLSGDSNYKWVLDKLTDEPEQPSWDVHSEPPKPDLSGQGGAPTTDEGAEAERQKIAADEEAKELAEEERKRKEAGLDSGFGPD
jgi:hypothetical protein